MEDQGETPPQSEPPKSLRKRSYPLYRGPEVEESTTCRTIRGYAYRNMPRNDHVETYCIGMNGELFSVKCYGTQTSFVLHPFKAKCQENSSQQDTKRALLEGKMESVNDQYEPEFFDNAIDLLTKIFEKVLNRSSKGHQGPYGQGQSTGACTGVKGDPFRPCKEHRDFIKKKLASCPRYKIRKFKARWLEQGWTLPTVTFLKCSFRSEDDRSAVMKSLKYELPLPNEDVPAFSLHEQRSDSVMAHLVHNGLAAQGWISFKDAREKDVAMKNKARAEGKTGGKKRSSKFVEDPDGRGAPFKTFVTDKVRQLRGAEYDTTIPKPKILSFDIETYTDRNSPMNPKDPRNPIFFISVVLWEPYHRCVVEDCDCGGIMTDDGELSFPHGLDNCRTTCILLSTKRVDAEGIRKNRPGRPVYVEETLNDERTMIMRFLQIILINKPNVVTGYNITNFDFGYIADRMKVLNMDEQLEILGVVKYMSESAAMKTNDFCYFDHDTAVVLDPFKIIQIINPNLTSYSLSAVANKYLGETKDPVDHEMITKAYEVDDTTPEGLALTTLVASYCVKDSELPILLINLLNMWVDAIEMARSGKVEITDTFARGKGNQMFKLVYSAIKNKDTPLRCIVENYKKDAFLYNGQMKKKFPHDFRWIGSRDYDPYVGAAVVKPTPTLRDNTVSFDFASMYPSLIIDYNLCLSTEVTEDRLIPVLDAAPKSKQEPCFKQESTPGSAPLKDDEINFDEMEDFDEKDFMPEPRRAIKRANPFKDPRVDDMEDFDGIVARKKAGIVGKGALQRFYVTEHKGCEHDQRKIDSDQLGKRIEEEMKRLREEKTNKQKDQDDDDDKRLIEEVTRNRKILRKIAAETSISSKMLFWKPEDGPLNLRNLETFERIKATKKTPLIFQPGAKAANVRTAKGKPLPLDKVIERAAKKLKTQRRLERRRVAAARKMAGIQELRRKRRELKVALVGDRVVCNNRDYFFITEHARLAHNAVSLVNLTPLEKSRPEFYDAETDGNDALVLSSVTDEESEESPTERRVRRKTVGERKIIEARKVYRELIGRGVIPIIQMNLLKDRVETRKRMKNFDASSLDYKVLDARQKGIKVNMNSIYGCLGASTSAFNSKTIARCVTHMGRRSNGRAAEVLQKVFGAQLIYGDTDSCYVTIPRIEGWPIEKKWAECQRISSIIELELPNELNLEFEDSFYTKFLIFGKKRYCYNSISDPKRPDKIKFSSKGTILDKKNQPKFSKESFELAIKTIVFRDRPAPQSCCEEGVFCECNVARLSRTAALKAEIISFLVERVVLLQIYADALWNKDMEADQDQDQDQDQEQDPDARTCRELIDYFTISMAHRVVGTGVTTTKNRPCSMGDRDPDSDSDSDEETEGLGGEDLKVGKSFGYYGSYKVPLFKESQRDRVLAEFDGNEEMYLRDKLPGPAMLVARMRSRGDDFAGRVNHVVLEKPVVTFEVDPLNKLPKMKKKGYKLEEKEHYLHHKRQYSKIDVDYYFGLMAKSFEKLFNACCCLFQNEEKDKTPGNTMLKEYGDTIYKDLTTSIKRKRACMREILEMVQLAT